MSEPHPEPPRAGGRAHALEFVLAPSDDEQVRQVWASLEEAGVPSAARHRGATHRPHVTFVSGPRPPEIVWRRAAELLGPLLPLSLTPQSLARLPGGRGPVVELLPVTEELASVRAVLVSLWPGCDRRSWLPHLTLAPRPGDEGAQLALATLPPPTGNRTLAAARWWDPDREAV